jgi:hypothetical protein
MKRFQPKAVVALTAAIETPRRHLVDEVNEPFPGSALLLQFRRQFQVSTKRIRHPSSIAGPFGYPYPRPVRRVKDVTSPSATTGAESLACVAHPWGNLIHTPLAPELLVSFADEAPRGARLRSMIE